MGELLITSVDSALERLIRTALPLPADVGDVSFDPPDRSWSARQSRVTVNVFLFDVGRSERPALPPVVRTTEDGRLERRPALPLVHLSYLVTAWAGNLRDEHQLLGDVLGCLLTQPSLDPSWFPQELPATATLSLSDRQGRKPGEIIAGLGADLRPGMELGVTVALGADWRPAASAVRGVEGRVSRIPGAVGPEVAADEATADLRRRRTSTGTVSERTS